MLSKAELNLSTDALTVEQAIEHALAVYEQNDCNMCGRQHKQLANWLTELLSLREQLAALKALPAIPKELFEIGELIRTQDNRITDQPFFAVMVKREIISSEDHDYDRICWVENQSGDYCEATDTQHRRLEAIYQGKYEVRDGWDRYAMKEIDVFVTGCFTEQGCKDYICRNRHNMNKPFVYAFGSYRNNEYQVVRNFLQSLTAAKQ